MGVRKIAKINYFLRMSVHLSVSPSAGNSATTGGNSLDLAFGYFSKTSREISSLIKI